MCPKHRGNELSCTVYESPGALLQCPGHQCSYNEPLNFTHDSHPLNIGCRTADSDQSSHGNNESGQSTTRDFPCLDAGPINMTLAIIPRTVTQMCYRHAKRQIVKITSLANMSDFLAADGQYCFINSAKRSC